jgi:thermostable 8-oxoguanine DNA glycosylase
MEKITKLVRGKTLLDCTSLQDVGYLALETVQAHCQAEFDSAWQSVQDRRLRPVTEEEFFKEYVFCVYVSGFSAKVVANKLDAILRAYGLYTEANEFVSPMMSTHIPMFDAVRQVWANRTKFDAILRTMLLCREANSWEQFHHKYLAHKSPEQVGTLPFMGPALRHHLARNIGNTSCAKPDLHLTRLVEKHEIVDLSGLGLTAVQNLCHLIKRQCKPLEFYPLGKVDMLLFFAAATLRS